MKNTKGGIVRDIFDIFETVSISLVVIFILLTMVFRICVVDGSSMEDTLQDGERLLVSDVMGSCESGDIIVFHSVAYQKPLVKRVIATEGQWVSLSDNSDKINIIVYDENQENPVDLTDVYGTYKDYYRPLAYFPFMGTDSVERSTDGSYYFQVPEGQLFVLGDNRNNSADSRTIGFIDERCVLGRLIVRLLPVSSFGTVD